MVLAKYFLPVFLGLTLYEMLWHRIDRGLHYFVWKLSTLTWLCMIFTIVYFSMRVLNHSRVTKISSALMSISYLVCLTLSCVVVAAYWGLYLKNPLLVDRHLYSGWDFDYLCNLFLHGGNLVLVVMEGYSLKDFVCPSNKFFLTFELCFCVAYSTLQRVSWSITGIPVYNFLEEFSTLQLGIFYLILYVFGISIKLLAASLISKNTDKKLK